MVGEGAGSSSAVDCEGVIELSVVPFEAEVGDGDGAAASAVS